MFTKNVYFSFRQNITFRFADYTINRLTAPNEHIRPGPSSPVHHSNSASASISSARVAQLVANRITV